jgi:pilus assembly protein FimV
MARKIAAVVFSLGCVHASSLMALGLGELTLDSFLNEPLKASVDLLNTGGLHEDQVKIRLATSEDFKRMGIDRAYFLTSITFTVDMDDSGQPRIVLTSKDPVLEPYLDFIIEARWPSGRLLREYTVLVDPPVFDQSNPVVSASQRVYEVEGEPSPPAKKPEAGPGTGTRVKVGKSDLAPGEMPRRNFNATTSERPVSGGRYMIHRDDTLWEIAADAKPAGASVHQTMLDIQRLNPDAFIDGNINRIKAGYIIYLPGEEDISSENLSVALQEVREQNQQWLESKDSEPDYTSGPSLRISAEPEENTDAGGAAAPSGAGSVASQEDMERVELERAEMAGRLQSMEEQVETLQRIVSLKDDQIAALQSALASGEPVDLEAQALTGEMGAEQTLVGEQAVESGDGMAGEISELPAQAEESAGDYAEEAEQETAEVVEVAEVAVVEEPAAEIAAPPAPAPDAEAGGIMSKLWYILGAVVLAVIGWIVMRSRGEEAEAEEPLEADTAAVEDVFADVELQDQPLEVEEDVAPEPALEPAQAELAVEDQVFEEPEPANRGYGQRKHDEYAADVEANDALAEADIYIAYGRHPQAVELLKNAIANEPGNPEYRVKLLEVHVDTGDQAAAMEQLNGLEIIGDADSLSRARKALEGAGGVAGAAGRAVADESPLMGDAEESLEADFSGLEIETPDAEGDVDEDLDLSADFDDAEKAAENMDEELVIAAESNGMSTKLDLARAYLDMGDDDGARQILEEVAAEGSDDLQAEARELLERIG